MKYFLITLLFIFSSPSLMASAVIIDFETLGPVYSFTGGVEDGFTISVDEGSDLWVQDGSLDSDVSDNMALSHVIGTLSGVSLVNGGLFSFTSVRSGGYDAIYGGTSRHNVYALGDVVVTGFLAEQIVGVDTFSPQHDYYINFSSVNLSGVDVDRLHIDMGHGSIGPNFIDDLVLETTVSSIPVPATVWLFVSGLFGLIGVARRKKA